jgi:tRNA pseudouridine38-40 synthase
VSGRTLRLTLAYRGTGFRGWAENEGVHTVAGTLRSALERVVGHPVQLAVAGRTDAGVHALGQVVSFTTTSPLPTERLAAALTALCGPDLAVLEAAEAAEGFHARFSARSRRYRYRILNRAVPDPLRHDLSWHVAAPLDLEILRLASVPLVGEHDFTSFCRRSDHAPTASAVRRVDEAIWCARPDDELHFEIEANAFCHQMVRALVGLLVVVGGGRRDHSEVEAVLAARDRAAVKADVAPAAGLTLVAVRYGADPPAEASETR